MARHTPGPWHVEQDWVVDSDGNRVCTVDGDGPNERDNANAPVLAAAPDLLALAEEVAKDYEDAADWKDARGRLFDMARAAIKKARGE